MLSNDLLVAALKNGATNEEIYELIRLIYGEAIKTTYYSLLQNDKYYQLLLAKTDTAEKNLAHQNMSSKVKASIDHFIELSDELEDEAHSVLYLSAFIDSYHFFKALGLVNC